jgi:hypothetical protein
MGMALVSSASETLLLFHDERPAHALVSRCNTGTTAGRL